jgi:hypothetical protein
MTSAPSSLPWYLVVLCALITGCLGTFLAAVVGGWGAKIYHMSNFEGAVGYFVVWVCAPLGFIVGIVTAIIVARQTGGTGFADFAKAQGLALLVTAAIAGAVGGVLYLMADHPPKIQGQELVLEFEIRLPVGSPMPDTKEQDAVRASLYASHRDYRAANVQVAEAMKRDGRIVVPGSAFLYSQSAYRSLIVGMGPFGSTAQMFDLPLPARPRIENEEWTDWKRPERSNDGSPLPVNGLFEVRYRVQRVTE